MLAAYPNNRYGNGYFQYLNPFASMSRYFDNAQNYNTQNYNAQNNQSARQRTNAVNGQGPGRHVFWGGPQGPGMRAPNPQPVRPVAGPPQQFNMPPNMPRGNQPQRMATPEELGIRYEPLESLFSGVPSAESVPATVHEPPAKPMNPGGEPKTESTSSPVADTVKVRLRQFAQNERNGSLFYKHLASLAPDEHNARLLSAVAESSTQNSMAFSKLLKAIADEDNAIKETLIDDRVDLKGGVKWALREESQAIKDLAVLYETSAEDLFMRSLSAILMRKIGDLGILMGLAGTA